MLLRRAGVGHFAVAQLAPDKADGAGNGYRYRVDDRHVKSSIRQSLTDHFGATQEARATQNDTVRPLLHQLQCLTSQPILRLAHPLMKFEYGNIHPSAAGIPILEAILVYQLLEQGLDLLKHELSYG